MATFHDLTEIFLDRYRLAAVIQAVEEDLRSFIRQYVSPYIDPAQALGDKLEELQRRARADGVVELGAEGLVDYLDFGDAFALLNRHSAMVPEALGGTVRALTPAFEIAVPIRNRVMHGRPLLPADEEQVGRLGQSVATAEWPFPLTRQIVARLLEEPGWEPLIEIASNRYGQVLHNLPLPEFDETGLLGRDEELRQVKDLLVRRRYPVITIAGEGGIGKTALAVRALYDLIDTPDAPVDAVLWASLKTERLTGRGIAEIRHAAVDVLSLTEHLADAIAEDAGSDVAMLAEVLEGARAVVAIDNVESIGAAELREFIDALPDAQFVLTSRVGLGEIERRITLGPLAETPAKLMLRQLAARRGLPQLARMNDRQAQRVVDRLRRSPLAIRWFVEAVQVGGQPDSLLQDQSAVLQFCMSSIYDSLAPEGQGLVGCLLAIEASATVGQLALLADLHRDEVQEQIYELQRRAIVQVEPQLSETLTQSYALSAMAREYLRRFGSIDRTFSHRVQKKLREIAATDEVARQLDRESVLQPMAITVQTPEEKAVASVLREALRKSKRGDLESARAEVARARDAVPSFFETYRVGAFIESSSRPEEARRLYEEAYRLAPEDARAKVAYWYAGHLLSMMCANEAEPLAREAHEGLAIPDTAFTLGRVCMYEGARFDEAEDLLLFATRSERVKSRIIAETMLLDLAKRRVERLAEEEKQPAAALRVALDATARAESVLASGVVDRVYQEHLAALVSECLLVALRLPDVDAVSDEVALVLEMVDRNFRVLALPGLRDEWASRLGRLCSHEQCPDELVAYGRKLETRLDQRLVLAGPGRAAGEIVNYSGKKKYGFIRPLDGGENAFFPMESVNDPQDRLLLTRGALVKYSPQETVRDGQRRVRASDVSVASSEDQRDRAFSRRGGVVVYRADAFLFAEDAATQERVFVHRSAFRDRDEWHDAREDVTVTFDIEFNAQGPKAKQGSVRLARHAR